LESADVHDLEQDRFPLRLAFFRYLRPETRLYQLERRRGYVPERLAPLRAARDRMDTYPLELVDHGLDEREREIAWLDRLIAAERDSTLRGTPRKAPPASSQSMKELQARDNEDPARPGTKVVSSPEAARARPT